VPSIIEGYNYDIFISYRQKDNKGDKWVSEFVEALKTELESTFKEEISVYFDINPHDGLLETHDVNESLKGKLKCLVFIPIISRTYCDPKSFAWEHEFKAFVELGSKDQFGLKVKLPNGNVANRVLPIRIHDLDPDDIKLCESVLGGIFRGIEFIYKEPGVNKPLTADDDEKKNLNNTKYRIQVNKVANSIKEIISGLKTKPTELDKEIIQQKELLKEVQKEEKIEVQKQPAKLNKRKLLIGSIIIVVLLLVAAIFVYPKIFHSGKSKTAGEPNGKMSIVVNTFENKTGDVTMDPWKEIIPDLLRGYLATSKELSVQNSQIMFEVYESIKQTHDASLLLSKSNEAAVRLKADSYLTGNFQRIGNNILIVSSLLNTKSGEILMTRNVEGNINTEYKEMTDSLSRQIKNFLEIKTLEQNADKEYQEAFTNSVEAYRKYIEGMKFIMNGNYQVAAKTLEEAYRIDTNFIFAAFFCSFASCYFDHNKAAYWERKAYPGKERLTEDYRMWLEFWHGWFNTKNTNDILNYCSSVEKSGTKSRFILFDIGCAYTNLRKPDKSVSMFEKVEKVSSEWGEPWKYRDYYIFFSNACHLAGKYDKEAKVLKTGLNLFPDDPGLIWNQARLAFSNGNTKKANELIIKYNYQSKRSGISESDINTNIGSLYEEADSLGKAEEFYRKALAFEPENAYGLNNLAYFLIDKDQNIDEGLELVDKALELIPNNIDFQDTKGWGLYKQGKYKEALDLLEKSWALSPSYSWHETYIHLEAAKKAVAVK
jgi:tetratricopeptide (TPR) repeat protein